MDDKFVNISKSDKVVVEIVFKDDSEDNNGNITLERTVVEEKDKPEQGDLITYQNSFFKVVDSKEKRRDKKSYIVKCSVELADLN